MPPVTLAEVFADAFILAIYVLAIARLTRLINADKVASFIRMYPATKVREATLRAAEASAHARAAEAVAQTDRQRRWSDVYDFLICPWCIGWWFALAGSYPVVWFVHMPWYTMFPVALATSHLVGVLARFADTEEIEITDAPEDDDD